MNEAIAVVIKPIHLTTQFAIGPQVGPDDFARLADAGFKSIINARPDTEDGDFLRAAAAAELSASAGLGYIYSPTENHAIFETDAIDQFEQALTKLLGPVFAHCKSGTRAAILWALVAVRHQPTDDVIAQLGIGRKRCLN